MLWRAWQVWGEPRPTPRLVGGLLMGAGAYGLLDSIVLHAALSLHRFARAGDAEYFAGALIALALGMRVSTIPNRARRRERARGA